MSFASDSTIELEFGGSVKLRTWVRTCRRGWPEAVWAPKSDDFEASAIAWLLDVVPPEYRQYGVLRRHPTALAAMAQYYAPLAAMLPAYAPAAYRLSGTNRQNHISALK